MYPINPRRPILYNTGLLKGGRTLDLKKIERIKRLLRLCKIKG